MNIIMQVVIPKMVHFDKQYLIFVSFRVLFYAAANNILAVCPNQTVVQWSKLHKLIENTLVPSS